MKFNYQTYQFDNYEFTPNLTEHATLIENDLISKEQFNNIITPLFQLITNQVKVEIKKEKPLFIPSLFITGNASTTKNIAKNLEGIDTLKHPDINGMHFGNPFSHYSYPGV